MQEPAPRTIFLKDYTPPAYLVEHVDLTFDLVPDATTVRSKLTLKRNPDAKSPGALVLDGQGIKLKSIHLDGRALDDSAYALDAEHLTLHDPPAAFVLELEGEINPAANKALEGLYVSSGNFCTQCEAEGFRRITWYLDRPDVMSTFRTTLIGDKAKYPVLLSNGNLVESRNLDDGRHLAVWEDPFKKPCYLFALVAGDLDRLEDTFTTMSGRTVDLHVYVERGNLDQTDHCMASLKHSMKWDEEVFGREYDLDLFQIVAVGDFNMGAMENKGLNIFNTKYVLARPDTATDVDYQGIEGVVGHEYFHNWSGNRVTCRDWFQLSLKEGFTVFRDQQFSADMGSSAVKRIDDVRKLRANQFLEDGGPTAHPVRPDSYVEISNFYTLTIYEKGAEVVRMLHTLLGPETFRKGTDLYFARHDGQAVTCDDFVAAMADASGRDLTQFLGWYRQAGTPVVTATTSYDAAAKTYTLQLAQMTPPTPGQTEKAPLHIPVKVGLLDENGKDLPLKLEGQNASTSGTILLELKSKEQSFVFVDVPHRPVASILRGFSAPVKLKTDASDDDLSFRMAHDSDSFNRWDAAQELSHRVIGRMVESVQKGEEPEAPESFIEAFSAALNDEQADPALLSEALSLPTEIEIGDRLDVEDPDAVHTARLALKRQLAETLGDSLSARYEALADDGAYKIDAASIGKRRLKNLCLSYLMASVDDAEESLAAEQYARAGNMTDSLAALACLNNIAGETRENALASFYEKWKGEALVLDKWFTMQATSTLENALDVVKGLTKHPAFSIENPNKVRSLIGAFARANPVRFHAADGAGYAFLADHIITLDGFNPQIAARLIAPLSRWRRFDDARQAKMKGALERILKHEGVSKDVYELASKSLADAPKG